MPSLLIIVFAFQLLIHLINTVGAPAINNIVSSIFVFLKLQTEQWISNGHIRAPSYGFSSQNYIHNREVPTSLLRISSDPK